MVRALVCPQVRLYCWRLSWRTVLMSSHKVVLLEVEQKNSADVLTWGCTAGGWAEGQCWCLTWGCTVGGWAEEQCWCPHMRLYCWRLSWRTVLASSHEVVLLEVELKDSADVLTWGCTAGGWAEEQCWCPHMRLYCWRFSWRTVLASSHEVVLLEVELKDSADVLTWGCTAGGWAEEQYPWRRQTQTSCSLYLKKSELLTELISAVIYSWKKYNALQIWLFKT